MDSSSDDDASSEETKEKKRDDEKDEKKGRGEGKKVRRDSRPVSHDHELQWFTGIEVYTCDHCKRSKPEMWMCVVAVRPECLYAECNECSRKRLKREQVDPAAAIARWSTKLKPVRTLTFTGHAFALPPHCASTPLGLFHRFVTVDLIDRMVDATNLYAHRAERKTKVCFLFPFMQNSQSHLVCT